MNKHIVSILVENKAGILNKVTGLFSRRGYNIDSLSVGTTEDETISRITIVVIGDDAIIDQIVKQLNKLICVIKVKILPQTNIGREMCFVKLEANEKTRSAITELVGIFRANIVDAQKETFTVLLTGGHDKMNAFIELAKDFGIIEIVRSGFMAIERGTDSISG